MEDNHCNYTHVFHLMTATLTILFHPYCSPKVKQRQIMFASVAIVKCAGYMRWLQFLNMVIPEMINHDCFYLTTMSVLFECYSTRLYASGYIFVYVAQYVL